MPITVPDGLPSIEELRRENIFTINEYRANHQDIRPLKMVILNLMPKKVETETQLLRMLSNTPLQMEMELLQVTSHKSKNTPQEHLLKFYKTFGEIRQEKFDGMIITGAPVEQMPFEAVDYWEELCQIMEWTKSHVFSTLYICWGAQAGLYYHYKIPKYDLPRKMFGIYDQTPLLPTHELLRGFNDRFPVPHSRHTEIRAEDIAKADNLQILAASKESGVHLVGSKDGRQFFVTGHSEYDRDTLANEYHRDLAKNLPIQIPEHYFPGDDPGREPLLTWRSHGSLFYSNWLNYFVYQKTPFDLSGQF